MDNRQGRRHDYRNDWNYLCTPARIIWLRYELSARYAAGWRVGIYGQMREHVATCPLCIVAPWLKRDIINSASERDAPHSAPLV